MGQSHSQQAPGVPAEQPKQPMWVLPMQTFMEMSGPPPGHQELQKLESLVPWESNMLVIFVSHQWVGNRHPDPRGLQLEELRQGMRHLFSGDLDVCVDMETELFLKRPNHIHSPTILPQEFVARLQHAHIWYDYWSIPQVSLALPGQEDAVAKALWASVMSIPEYIGRCQLFVSLCPAMAHEDTGEACNFRSWQQRGWCRLEQLCSGLRIQPMFIQETIVVSSSRCLRLKGKRHWLFAPVGDGSFTVESDRELLRPLVQSLLEQYAETMATSLDPDGMAKSRFIRAVTPVLMTGLAPEAAVEESAEAFLALFKFRTLRDRGEGGFGPLHCAALGGWPRVLEAAVAAGADVDVATTTPVNAVHLEAGQTPFSMAMMHSQLEVVKSLMRLRADMTKKDAAGLAPIHRAAVKGTMMSPCFRHHELLELLLESGVPEEPYMPHMPLAAAGCGLGPNTKPLQVLLARGAALDWCSMLGGPLHGVALWGYSGPEAVDILVKGRADVNQVLRPDGAAERAILAAVQLAPRGKKATELWTVFPEMRGATPLLLAALKGNWDICKALLLHMADHESRNGTGLTALDAARSAGHRQVVQLLESWESLSVVLFEDEQFFCL